MSILSIFCGCGLFGLINLYMANQAKQFLQQGDLHQAQEKIKVARMLCIVGYVLFALNLIGVAAYLVFVFVVMQS